MRISFKFSKVLPLLIALITASTSFVVPVHKASAWWWEAEADLSIGVNTPEVVSPGERYKSSFEIKNTGPDDAQRYYIYSRGYNGASLNPALGSECRRFGSWLVCYGIAAGETKTIPMELELSDAASCDSKVRVYARVYSFVDDPDPQNNTDYVDIPVFCEPPKVADLSLSVPTHTPESPSPGDIIRFNQVIANAGPEEATNVTLRSQIPKGTNFDPRNSHPSCRQEGSDVICQEALLAEYFDVAFQVHEWISCGYEIEYTARVSADQDDPEPPFNNERTVEVEVPCPEADLEIGIDVPLEVNRGEDLAYLVGVKNNGPDHAGESTAYFIAPGGLSFKSVDNRCRSFAGGRVVMCPVPGIDAGKSEEFSMVYEVKDNAKCGGELKARGFSFGGRTPDPDRNNNATDVSTQVACKTADVSVKKAGPENVEPGGDAEYNLGIRNDGPGVATDAIIIDHIPDFLYFRPEVSDPACGVKLMSGEEVLVCRADVLNSGEGKEFDVTFGVDNQVPCDAVIENWAEARSPEEDPDDNNNYSELIETGVECPIICGDGRTEGKEDCDEGGVDTETCNADCTFPVCGDEYINTVTGEECDDGNQAEDDQCNNVCLFTSCGDDVIQDPNGNGESETCDDGVYNGFPLYCNPTCTDLTTPVCGNEVQEEAEECDDGNLDNGDGCSSVCTIEAPANLFITQKSPEIARITAAPRDVVTLIRFDAVAVERDVLLTQLKFAPRDGSALNAKNYELWMDNDSDGTVDAVVSKSHWGTSELVFQPGLGNHGNTMPVVIPQGNTVIFEVRATIKESRVSDTIQFEFRSFVDGYVEARDNVNDQELWGIETNGSCISTCNIFVETVDAVVIEISEQCSLPDYVSAFVSAGYFSHQDACDLMGTTGIRGDYVKLIVEMNGGILSSHSYNSFEDVPPDSHYYRYFEEAGAEGWIRGDNNCYGTHPCYARPLEALKGEEFSAISVRTFGLPQGQSDDCVLLPDGSELPTEGTFFWEQILWALFRIDTGQQWGQECGGGDITSCILPGTSQLDIASDGDYLYLVAWDDGGWFGRATKSVYKMDKQCNVIEEYTLDAQDIFGLTYGMGKFWATSEGGGTRGQLHKLEDDFSIKRSVYLPFGAAQGAAFDTTGLVWVVYNTEEDEITVTNVLDGGTTEFKFNAPANAPYGLAVNVDALWVGANGNIYALDKVTGSIRYVIQSPSVGGYISGLTILDGELWIVDNDDDKLYHIPLPLLPPPECGNGIWEGGEECDDGNNVDGDGCSAECRIEASEVYIRSIEAISSTQLRIEFSEQLDRASAENAANYEVAGLTVDTAVLTNSYPYANVKLTFGQSMIPDEEYTLFVTGRTAGGTDLDEYAVFLGYDPHVQPGGLEVNLHPNTPLGDTVPRGAIGVALLSADFTASCENDVQVEGLTLIHEGQGSQADISNAWMSVNGTRVSRTRTFDSEDQTADLRFMRPLLIEACETVTVDFMADFYSTAATYGHHNYVIELASDIISNAQHVTGSFPVRGETFRIASVTTGTVTTTYQQVAPTQVDINDQDAFIGKWEFSINTVEDQTFYSIMLENTGTARDGDFINIYVQRTDGTPLTRDVAQTVADYVTLTFDPPFTVLEGDYVTLEAVADIVNGAEETINMQFEEANDVFAVGSLYGYGVNGQLYGSQVTTTGIATTVTINAGELTVDIDGPITEEYTPDADDIVMANIDFVTGGEDAQVNELYAMIMGQTSIGYTLADHGPANDSMSKNVEDVELRNTVTGQTIDAILISENSSPPGPTNGTTNTSAIYRFDDFILRDASRWELRMDFVAGVPMDGDRFKAAICTADENDVTGCDFGGYYYPSTLYNFDVEGLSTGTPIYDIRPGEDLFGNYMEVATSMLSLAERSLGTSDTAVENAQDVTFFRFEATASKSEDIFLTNIEVKADAGTLADAGDYTLWVDSDDDGSVDTILESGRGCEGVCDGSVQTDGSVDREVFDDLAGGGYTIPAEDTVMFEVHADISGSLHQSELSIGFNDTAGQVFIEAEEADDGTSLTGIGSSCTSATQICVTTTTSKIYMLKSNGTLYVYKDSVPTRSRQLLAGALGEAVLRLELRAEDEPIDVTRLAFTNLGPGTGNINRLRLYREGESTAFATATADNCDNISTQFPGNSFCAVMESQQLVIPAGERADVLVRPDLLSDEYGVVNGPGGEIQIVLLKPTDYGTPGTPASTTGLSTVCARGFNSSNVLNFNNNDFEQDNEIIVGRSTPGPDEEIRGNENDTVLAKIVSIEDVNPDADGTQVPQGTNKRLAEFKYTAATNQNTSGGRNKATIRNIIFTVSSNNVVFAADSFDMYNKNDQTQQIHCTQSATSGTIYVECSGDNNELVDLEMDSGESVTLVLQADITDNQVSSTQGSAVSVSITNFSDRSIAGSYGPSPSQSHIEWSDSYLDSPVQMFRWIEYGQTQISSTSYSI